MNEAPSVNRILVPGQTATDGPAVPEWFRERLRQMDSTLVVSWNRFRRRFVIEQCTEHYPDGAGQHSHVCRRSYVLLAQDPEGAMMPLGERVLEMIRERDVTKAGYGPDSLKRFIADMERADQEQRARNGEKQEQAIREGSRDNRRQLNQAVDLIQRHNLTPNK